MAQIDTLVENLKKRHRFSEADIAALLSESELSVPVKIFSNRRLGALEALAVHLKDKEGMRFSEIARQLKRDQRTIWVSYHNAKRKLR